MRRCSPRRGRPRWCGPTAVRSLRSASGCATSRRGATRCRSRRCGCRPSSSSGWRCGGATRSATCSRSCSWAARTRSSCRSMHESAHRLLFAEPARQRPRRPLAARLPVVHVDRRVPPRAHGPPPSGVRARRARHPAVRGLPDQPGELPAQAGARRDRPDRVQALPSAVRRLPLTRRPGAPHALEDPAGPGGAVRRRDRGRRVVGVPGVLGAAVPDRLAGDQPSACDRRARRHGRVDRPSGHDALGPPVVVGAARSSSRSTSAGTSRTTSTPACRCDTSPSTTGRCTRPATSRRASSSRPTARSGVRCATGSVPRNRRGTRQRRRRVRKLRAWSSGSRTPAAW